MSRTARVPGEIEYSDQRGAGRLEQVLRTDGVMPREVRARLETRLREYRDRPFSLDLDCVAGRVEHSERLLTEVQAENVLRSN
jgi:hypothetical protein